MKCNFKFKTVDPSINAYAGFVLSYPRNYLYQGYGQNYNHSLLTPWYYNSWRTLVAH